MLNLEPGDEFEIKLGKAIRLIPTGVAATHSEGAEGLKTARLQMSDPHSSSSSGQWFQILSIL